MVIWVSTVLLAEAKSASSDNNPMHTFSPALVSHQVPLTEKVLLKEIEAARNAATDPYKMLNTAEEFIQKSHSINNQQVYVQAAIAKLEALIFLEQIADAQALFDDLKPLIEPFATNLNKIRYGIANIMLLFNQGEHEQLESHYAPLIEQAASIGDKRMQGEVFLAIGNIQTQLIQASDAINSFKNAYNLFEEINDNTLQTVVVGALANVYSDIGELELSNYYHYQVLEIDEATGNRYSESVSRFNIAKNYAQIEAFDKALAYFNQAKDISIEINDNIGVTLAAIEIASIYNAKAQWDLSIESLVNVKSKLNQGGGAVTKFVYLSTLAEAYLGSEKTALAAPIIEQLSFLQQEITNDEIKRNYFLLSAQFAFLELDYQRAYSMLNLARELEQNIVRDKLDIEAQKNKVAFETRLTQQQNELLLKENEINALTIEQQRSEQQLSRLILLGVSFVLFSLAVILFIQVKHREKFKQLAFVDSLTQGPNRRAIMAFAEKVFNRAVQDQSTFSIALIDLDNFKKINDRFGHYAGDEVLKAFAKTCENCIRQEDGFGRYGGEEWLLILPDTQAEHLEIVFKRLFNGLNSSEFESLPKGKKITFSMGVVEFEPQQYQFVDEMISEADDYLYIAKALGRNRLVNAYVAADAEIQVNHA